MPPRLARSSVQTAAPKTARNKNNKRNLNAYAIASHSAPSKNNVKQHRLGEFLDDRPAPKRRRDSEDDDVAALDEEDVRSAAKKRKATLDDDDIEEGSDSEGNNWTLGGLAEDDEDSDLDSEEAFGESDEERFEGFTFRGSRNSRPAKRKSRQDFDGGDWERGTGLDEREDEGHEEEEEDDFGDEGVDLATMLDDDKDDGQNEGEGSGSEEDEDESGSESGSHDSEKDEQEDEERNARMRDRLEALDGDQQADKPKQRAQQNTLSVDDLLADLDPAAKKQFAAATKTKKRSERPTTLAAPLPKRQQDKLNREVASQKAKEQLDRWRDTVIQNRRAEHLSFPLKHPDEAEPQGKDKFLETKPQNELEANIQRIMEESGMASKDGENGADDGEYAIMKAEGMEAQKMDVDEVMQRRAELRKARELLFYEEKKAKRIAKIKSKSYRRVHRKEKARQAEQQREEREMLGLEPMDEDEKEAQDRRRAEQRMSTKHRDSKWAKQLKQTNRATWDEGARDSVNEEARRREELKRRIEGRGGESEEGDDSIDEEDGEDEGAFTLRQLEGLQNGAQEGREKGLAGMKFMRDADARRKAQNDEDVERIRKELAIENGDEADSGDEIDNQGLGRAIFGPPGQRGGAQREKKKTRRPELEEGSESEAGEAGGEDGKDGEVEIVTEKKGQQGGKTGRKPPQTANGNKGSAGGLRKLGGLSGSKNGDQQEDEEFSSSWLRKGSKKSRKGLDLDEIPRIKPGDKSAATQLEQNEQVKAARPNAPPFLQERHEQASSNGTRALSKAGTPNGGTLIKYSNPGDSASDSEPDTSALTPAAKNAALQSRAFAGDDVRAAFDAEKAAQEESEDEQETSTHLPGWGSWTGAGLSRSLKRAEAKQKHNPLFRHKTPGGVKKANRQDAKLPDVIVSEKREGKGSRKYLAGQLPQGFARREEYEGALRRPVGEEWATKGVVQGNVKPRVMVERGRVVGAMERPMV